jgi:hypothetical protein
VICSYEGIRFGKAYLVQEVYETTKKTTDHETGITGRAFLLAHAQEIESWLSITHLR